MLPEYRGTACCSETWPGPAPSPYTPKGPATSVMSPACPGVRVICPTIPTLPYRLYSTHHSPAHTTTSTTPSPDTHIAVGIDGLQQPLLDLPRGYRSRCHCLCPGITAEGGAACSRVGRDTVTRAPGALDTGDSQARLSSWSRATGSPEAGREIRRRTLCDATGATSLRHYSSGQHARHVVRVHVLAPLPPPHAHRKCQREAACDCLSAVSCLRHVAS